MSKCFSGLWITLGCDNFVRAIIPQRVDILFAFTLNFSCLPFRNRDRKRLLGSHWQSEVLRSLKCIVNKARPLRCPTLVLIMAVSAVYLGSDAFLVCMNHALSTEKEEVMGLCIGEVTLQC